MRKIALVSACLASTSRGRPVGNSAQQLQSGLLEDSFPAVSVPGTSGSIENGTPNPLHALAMLLHTFNAATAFNPTGPVTPKSLRRLHPSQRNLVIRMDEDQAKETQGVVEGTSFEYKYTDGVRVGAKEFFDDAREKVQLEFDETVAKRMALARSEETIAAHQALAEAAVTALQGNSEVAAALEKKKKPTTKVEKALRRGQNTMALVGEPVKCEDLMTFGGYDLDDPTYLSEQYRDGGATVVFAKSLYEDTARPDALKQSVAEQNTAKGQYPGPLPVVARMPVIDPLQLAEASLQGASGVVISLSIAGGKEKTAELMAAAEGLGLESLIRVTSEEQLSTAVELGAKIILIGDVATEEGLALLDKLPKGADKRPAVVTVADFPFLEVKGAWKIRDAGFHALVCGRELLDLCARDRVPPAATIKAMKAKGSFKYGTGLLRGRGEGSKEYLGSMAM